MRECNTIGEKIRDGLKTQDLTSWLNQQSNNALKLIGAKQHHRLWLLFLREKRDRFVFLLFDDPIVVFRSLTLCLCQVYLTSSSSWSPITVTLPWFPFLSFLHVLWPFIWSWRQTLVWAFLVSTCIALFPLFYTRMTDSIPNINDMQVRERGREKVDGEEEKIEDERVKVFWSLSLPLGFRCLDGREKRDTMQAEKAKRWVSSDSWCIQTKCSLQRREWKER